MMVTRYKAVSAWSVLVACTVLGVASTALAGPPPQCKLDTPTITCVSSTASSITLRICAGPSGAPAGISIQWETCADFDNSGGGWNGSSYNAISLSGQCPTSNWDLGPNECRNVTINASTVINENAGACGASGTPTDLLCNTCYIFRVFAHNVPGGCNDSDKSAGTRCSTAPCPQTGECTLTWGYWKTHGPDPDCSPGNQNNEWNVASLNIGGQSLDQAALCDIFHVNPGACNKQGQSNGGSNAVIILEHQLIAAMLNVANGAIHCDFANTAITQANAALTGHVYDCIGTSTPDGQTMVALAALLESYNSDQCSCPVAAPSPNSAIPVPSATQKASWGQLKSIYR